ncbi:hypothetical protein [Chthonobacter albigriseus]|uniref:hypothetical protein n=1 Tax=Chthonobacter albigriseus TaxID=1683161 RepID=UPI0015EE6AFE|nr:hypothetical protein [Chthonobacter albigriseus]
MVDRIEALRELNRRGKLPSDLQPLYDEAVKRGLIGGQTGYVQPAPPPGVIIHGSDGQSYVSDKPDVRVARDPNASERDNAVAMTALRQRGETGGMGAAGRAAMPVFQGVSSAYGDEAVSALKGATDAALGNSSFGDSYALSQEVQRQELDRQRTEHPLASTVGQVAGAVTQAPLLAGGVAASQGLPLAGRIAAGAGAGVGYGALEGFGAGSGLDDRLSQAGMGAMIGGAAGAALPVVGEGLRRGGRYILDNATINRDLAAAGITRPAADTLIETFNADGAFNGSGARNIASAGDDAMLADAGPAARQLLDTAMQRGGTAARVGNEAVEARAARANQRMTSALDDTLGRPQGVETTKAAIRQGSQPARSAAYDAAYSAPIDYASDAGRQVESLMRRVPRAVLNKANELMALEGQESAQILASVADDGTVSYMRMPDVRQLDYVTRALRDVAKSGDGMGALGGQTDVGRAYGNLARDIRTALRSAVPEYGQALDTAAIPIRASQATEFGSGLLSPSVTRDAAAEEIRGMSQAELAAVRQGVRSQIDEVLSNVTRAASDPNIEAREATRGLRDLSSRAARDKLSLILGDQAPRLFEQLDQASRAIELRAGTSRNSATFARQAADRMVEDMQAPGVIGTLAEGKPVNAVQRIAQILSGRTPQDKLRRKDEVYRDIVEVLTQRRGPNASATMDLLTDASRVIPGNEAIARVLANVMASGAAVGTYQAGRSKGDRR